MKILKKIKQEQGTSMVEIVFVVAIFSIVMVAVAGIFQAVLNSQKNAIAAQNTQESLRFAFEVMSKELRNAKQSDGGCEIQANQADFEIYNKDSTNNIIGNNIGDVLYFRNSGNECVYYYLEDDANGNTRLKIARDDDISDGIDNDFYITPDDVSVSNLYFDPLDNDIGAEPDERIQPTVTLKIEMNANQRRFKNNTVLQTTISSRYYR